MTALRPIITLVAGYILVTNAVSAAPHARVRLINSAPHASIVSLSVDTKKIASLVPPGETRKFKKMAAGNYVAHIYDGVLEALASPLTLADGWDYNILPHLENGKPTMTVLPLPPANKENKTAGLVQVVTTVDMTPTMNVYVDDILRGTCGPHVNSLLSNVPEGLHKITFQDPIFYLQFASGTVFIKGGSNNLVVLTGSLDPSHYSPLEIHTYNDQSKY